MPDIPRTLAQHCASVNDNPGMIAHILRLSEAGDKSRADIQRLEAELAAVRALLAKEANIRK